MSPTPIVPRNRPRGARRYLVEALTLQAGSLVGAASGVASSIVLAFVLGPAEQGRYYGAQAVFGLAFLLGSLGFGTGAVSRVAAARAADDPEAVVAGLAHLAKVSLLVAGVLLFLGTTALPFGVDALYEDRSLASLCALLSLTPLFDLPRAVVQAGLEGARCMRDVARLEALVELLRAAAVCTGAVLVPGAEGAATGWLVATALGSGLAVWVYHGSRRRSDRPLPALGTLVAAIPAAPVRRHARLGVELGLSRLSRTAVVEFAPPLVLLRFADASWVAWFRIASRLIGLPLMATQGFGRASLPPLSGLAARADWARLGRAFWRVTLATGGLRVLLLLGWLLAAPLVLRIAYPSDYGAPVAELMWILALGAAALSFTPAVEPFYVATGRTHVSVRINLATSAVTLALLLPLAIADGATGTAWALSIGTAGSFVHHAYVRRALSTLAGGAPVPAPSEGGP